MECQTNLSGDAKRKVADFVTQAAQSYLSTNCRLLSGLLFNDWLNERRWTHIQSDPSYLSDADEDDVCCTCMKRLWWTSFHWLLLTLSLPLLLCYMLPPPLLTPFAGAKPRPKSQCIDYWKYCDGIIPVIHFEVYDISVVNIRCQHARLSWYS